VILTLLACGDLELSQEWELDRLRLLAVRADPAEPRPGDTVTFSSLRYVPDDADWTAIWFACVVYEESGCDIDTDALAGLEDTAITADDIAALMEAGFAGVEPGMTPTWVVPDDALADLDTGAQLEGRSATVQVTLTTDADTELVVRAIPVSLATTPNTNPDVGSLTVDGEPADSAIPLVLTAGSSVDLVATLAGDLETYTYVNTDGETEERTEELEWRWYVSGGSLGGGFVDTGPEDEGGEGNQAWTAPSEAGDYELDVVVLDGRGGMGWWSQAVTVE
jgi:hypothetical protein